jgi:hypothetical protein
LMCDCVLDTSRSSPSRQDTINNEDRGWYHFLEVNYPADTCANSSITNINSEYGSLGIQSREGMATEWNLQWD